MFRNRWFWIVVVIVVVIVGMRVMGGKKNKEAETERVFAVVVANPQMGLIQEKILTTGDVKGETEVMVRPKTAGRVDELYVDEGDLVREGQKLMSYVAGIKEGDELYEDMVTFAPISGIVGMKYVKLGDQVTSSVGSISPAFTIYKIDNVKVLADVPERYFSALKVGLPAIMKLDAYPGELFRGRVNAVRPVIDAYSRTAQVEILAPNPGSRMKPGMFVHLELVLREKSGVQVIPSDAVLGDSEKYVFVVEGERAVKRPVSIGLAEDDRTEITSGLSRADQVISIGQRVVHDGAKVEISTHD